MRLNRFRDPGKPRSYRTDQTCRRKKRYADEIAARAAALVSMEEHGNTRRLWAYRCVHCTGWHLTSRPSSARYLITLGEREASA